MIQGTDVTLELKVRSMEHAIVQALTLYEGKLNEEIKEIVHSVCLGFDFKGELEKELRYMVKQELQQACRSAVQGRVRNFIDERITKVLEKLEPK